MPTEKFANSAQSTLNGAITAAATSLVVNSAATFPTTGNFRIKIDSEIMLVTAVSGTTFTVTRASESTSAATHSSGATVREVFTAGALDQRMAEFCQAGTDAALPAVEKAGRLYFETDSLYLNRDTGAAWTVYGPLFKLTKPVSGDFSWINQGSATIATTSGGVLLTAPAAAADSVKIRIKTAPSVPYTITAMILPMFDDTNFAQAGLCFRESSSGKLHVFQFGYDTNSTTPPTGLQLMSSKFTDATTFSAHYKNGKSITGYGGIPRFIRIADDNTNRICSFSMDGITFQTFHSIGRTDFLTANQVGFHANSVNSVAVYNHLLSWLEG